MARGKVHPSRPGGDGARGRPVGGPGDRAGLPGSADAGRSRAAVVAVARSRGSDPHSRPAPGSRIRRGRTPSRTPARGTAPCATAWLWLSRLPAAMPAQKRASRWAAITRSGRASCWCENLGARVRCVRPRRPAYPVTCRRPATRRHADRAGAARGFEIRIVSPPGPWSPVTGRARARARRIKPSRPLSLGGAARCLTPGCAACHACARRRRRSPSPFPHAPRQLTERRRWPTTCGPRRHHDREQAAPCSLRATSWPAYYEAATSGMNLCYSDGLRRGVTFVRGPNNRL